jgi:hypothetical protein
VYDNDTDFAYPYIQDIDPTKIIAAEEATVEFFCNVHVPGYNSNTTSAAKALLSNRSKTGGSLWLQNLLTVKRRKYVLLFQNHQREGES